jgi:hypothetical protein
MLRAKTVQKSLQQGRIVRAIAVHLPVPDNPFFTARHGRNPSPKTCEL